MEWFQAWRDIAPPDLVVVLARQDLSGLSDGVLLEYLAAVEKATAWLQSLRVVGLGEFAGRRTEPGSPLMGPEGYEQGTVKELSAHLHQSRNTLAPQLADAVQLCGHFPGTVAAMGEGRVDLGRASAIVRGSRDLPAAVLAEYEAQVLPGAEHVVRETVQDRARTARQRLHPQTLDERHTRAMEHRGLWFRPQEDGMAELSVHTGADTAMAVYNLVQEHAQHLKTLDGETRTLAQLRADVFTGLAGETGEHGPVDSSSRCFAPVNGNGNGNRNGMGSGTAFGATVLPPAGGNGAGTDTLTGVMDGRCGAAAGDGTPGAAQAGGGAAGDGTPGAAQAGHVAAGAAAAGDGVAGGACAGEVWGGGNVKSFVAVTIPLATAAGGDEPGELAGYGPIPPAMARRIAGLAKTWLPVITDEHDKAVMVAREMRHPPEWLKRHVRLRDGTCRGLGCRTQWKHCELDHTLAWEHGGKTELDNLALRCKPDHLSKHNDGWHTTQEPHGVIRHQTRTGQTYTSYPDGSWVSHGIKPPPPPPPDPFNDTTPPPF
ncbi:HNH endonuclease signature motif containing protein [Arthrobacter sp. Marseille-P9274]|uniref:HNH endonuclease signature motif containing protein n=1 Tax=Arthrobacter sp. Marseille-P9274 TaxID=2866572 RepID=UPI0021C65EDF|nr:HNH endonuclease signature motif containing protein [Arthrobacter sp. Marseille-P9274]